MADIFRGPLFTNRREIAPVHQPLGWVAQNLLVTLLVAGAAPMPPGAQACESAPKYRHNVTSTAAGTPPVLKGIPTALYVHQAPIKPKWQPADTSASVPSVLKGLPTVPVLHMAPARALWQPGSTAAGSPLTLYPAPFVAPPQQILHLAPQRALCQPADTSQGSPVQFYPDRKSVV
jgi:hypothetical protein